jgi:heme A synthase
MNLFLYCGVLFASIALVFYSMFFWKTRTIKELNRSNCIIQTIGLGFDISGTTLMIIGSKNIPLTVHGILGYSALLAMVAETILIWRVHITKNEKKKGINIYSCISYVWWICAYFAGGLIAMFEVKIKN